jgi:hypothetical protein
MALAAALSGTIGLLAAGSDAHAQCSSKTNIVAIASQTSGWIIDTWIDGTTEFAFYYDAGTATYCVFLGDASAFALDYAEDSNGTGSIDAGGDLACQIDCDSNGGVFLTVESDTQGIAAHAFSVSSTGTASGQTPRDYCPCSGVGTTSIRMHCTKYACDHALACKQDASGNNSAWCSSNSGGNNN